MKNKEFYMPLFICAAVTVVFSVSLLFVNKLCALCAFLLGVLIILVFAVYTGNRYRKLDELNSYLSLVCAGNYDLSIEDNAEGELSILKNNLYKVITMLKTQNEVIEKDKLYLAESLADISHQLKTPLTSMMVAADLLENENSLDKRHELTGMLNSQLERMRWLILTLLKLSKLDAGTAELNCSKQSISDIVEESVKPFLITLELKNITVERNIADFSFIGDKNWSIEAVQNMLKNCIEHSESGGSIFISAHSTSIYDELVIADNGAGIDEEDLPHVFERFYRGKNAAGDSVGIGLALAKSILNQQNAKLEVTSVKGEGTSFSVKFYQSVI